MDERTLTEQQLKWMASVRASLESSTGRALADWLEIARGCPETAPRARLRWFKETHGLGQNYASVILGELARSAGDNPRDPQALSAALWADPAARVIFEALAGAMAALPQSVTGQRKGYTAWSRAYAFAAARPWRGAVRLGLAVEPAADPRLGPAVREGWSERLKASLVLAAPDALDDGLRALVRQAWEAS